MASILVIDDDELLRDTIETVLKRAGHTIDTAADGIVGLRKIQGGNSFDLIITDILMPKSDGLEVMSNLKKFQPDTRVLAISGGGEFLSGDMAIQFARAFGAREVLYKPFSNAELVEVVEKLLA